MQNAELGKLTNIVFSLNQLIKKNANQIDLMGKHIIFNFESK